MSCRALFFAVLDYVSDPWVLVSWIAVLCAFAANELGWDRQHRLRARVRLWRIRRRQDRILWSGGSYVISQEMKRRLKIP